MQKIPSKGFTHAGRFHADEVFSTALLKILNPDFMVQRGFRVSHNFDGIVYDIGFGKFDHHQQDARVRENGVPYAAFGLLWEAFGELVLKNYCPDEYIEIEKKRFDDKFIKYIDKDDNTGCGNMVSDVISGFNPAWDTKNDENTCFNNAVDFATTILKNRFKSIKSMYSAKIVAEDALSKMQDGIVVLSVYAPWKMVLVPSEAYFVVYPSQRGGFSAQCVPNNDKINSLKVPFPKSWAGLEEVNLREVSQISTIKFCHNNCFIITATTKEDAILACYKAMENKEE